MDRKNYEEYLARFNARDYEGVLAYYAEDFEVTFAGISLHGRDQLLKFYSFLHSYLTETITCEAFVCDDRLVALEARVRIEGRRDLTAQALAEAGYTRLHPLQAGQVIEIPQLIHYHLANGKFVKALCAVVERP